MAITCGVCVGFLPHNFHPAKVFMGDSGSLLLGLLMAATTISVGGRTADQFSGQTYFFFAPLVIPFVILGAVAIVALFAVMATVLSGVGLHGLLAFGVAQRRREIGIRIAVGAHPARVARGALFC